MRQIRSAFAVVAVLAVFAAGCGDDEPAVVDSPDEVASELANGEDMDIDDLDDVTDALLPEDCEFLLELGLAPGLIASGQLDPADLDVDAPEEIAEAVEVYVAALAEYAKDPSGAGMTALGTDEVQEASDAIGSYVEEHCSEIGQ